ncbi:MAG: hypothetical protein HYS24_12850 [Ignavibacteriales bacterium]|nr:hypothetical protein [Ignavibacteriales bacterium]
MKKDISFLLLLIILINILCLKSSIAQTFNGNVILTTQSEVNSFGSENYVNISGNLKISGLDINDISSLSTLNFIGGDLFISDNSLLSNLNGLNGIVTINGNLKINNNAALTDLDGLTGITSVNGYLYINNNSALSSLLGLLNISSINGYLELSYNNALLNLDGLGGITSIGGYLTIASNTIITNLDGLNNILSVGADLSITTNPELSNFCGLYNLLNSNGLTGIYTVLGNDQNPTIHEIIENCGSILISAKIFLEGPYSSSDFYMNQALSVPLNSPYSQDPQSVSSIGVDVVDWVLLELRSAEDKSRIISSRSAFLLKDGTIVDLDGTSPVTFDTPNIRYYLVVKHRNHLAIMSNYEID